MDESPQLPVTSSGMTTIRALVGRARSRLRLQAALEGATTASILAIAAALAVVYGLRAGALTSTTATGLLVACAAIVLAGAAVGASRRVDDERVARRIDRANDLADRLSTAVAFDRALATGNLAGLVDGSDSEETHALMEAAIRDAVRAAPRADVAIAAPYAVPRDARAAAVFAVVAALAAGLGFPTPNRTPAIYGAFPNWGRPLAHVVIKGEHLRETATRPVEHAMIDRRTGLAVAAAGANLLTAAKAPAGAHDGMVVTLGRAEGSVPVKILDWQSDAISIEIPANAAPGDTELSVWIDGGKVGTT